MAEDYSNLQAILDRLSDGQAEIAGLRPTRDIRPAMVPYNLYGANALAANASKTDSFAIGGSDRFIATEVRFTSTGSVLLNLRPSTMPEDWSTGAFHSVAGFGPQAAPMPLMLPRPWLLEPTTTVRVDMTDLSAATNPLFLLLVGFRVRG
jgi:hypothetical protein